MKLRLCTGRGTRTQERSSPSPTASLVYRRKSLRITHLFIMSTKVFSLAATLREGFPKSSFQRHQLGRTEKCSALINVEMYERVRLKVRNPENGMPSFRDSCVDLALRNVEELCF